MSNDIENLIGLDEAELKRMGISKKGNKCLCIQVKSSKYLI